jgi:hypothetical protein
MYKVFVNDKPILLSDHALSHSEYEIYLFKDTRFEEIVHKLQNTNTSGIYLYHNDLEVLWNKFVSYFEVVTAAGGLVLNDRKIKCYLSGAMNVGIYLKGEWNQGKLVEKQL